MKTIFRTFSMGLFLALILALGAVAGVAQDPCIDIEGQNALYDKFLAAYNVKTLEGRKQWVELGKQYVEKYGNCTTNETVKTNSAYFNTQIPKWTKAITDMGDKAAEDALIKRFDTALKAKNWDDVYAAGKEILTRYPEKYRTAEIVLAAVGGEEAFKANYKYGDDSMRYAKQSIADLEANKSFDLGGKPRYGLSLANSYNFEFASREDALAWLNLYAGYVTSVSKKQKKEAIPFLYKASQLTSSDASKNPVVYELIGSYYFDELNKLVEQIKAAAADQKDTDTAEVAQQKVDNIKKLVAQSNGTAERAMDAFSRAFTFAKDATVKARMKKNVEDAYRLRFGNTTAVDAWITKAVAKPFVNPTTPIAPISDPEPAKTGDAKTTPAATQPLVNNTTTVLGKPTAPMPTKPATTVTKPAVKHPAKPKAAVKKTTRKRTA